MIFGWHATARKFLKHYQGQLKEKKTAYFACAARLTFAEGEQLPQNSIVMDPNLVSKPVKTGRLNLKERFTTLKYYLDPMLGAAPQV
jgi:menaquinone-dependent protoporphyrinogen IX oxidase